MLRIDSDTILVNELEFEHILEETKGAKPVTIVAKTFPKVRKTNNPHPNIVKVSRVNGMVNFIYENAVNNQRKREGETPDFEAAPRQWGQRIEGTPLVKHNDKTYLEFKVERSLDYHYEDNGIMVPEDEVAPFLPKRSESSRQNVEKEVILRDYAIENIVSVRMNGETLLVSH